MSSVVLVTNVRHFLGLASARAISARGAKVVCHDASFGDRAEREAFVAETGFAELASGEIGGGLARDVLARYGRIEACVSNDVHPAERVTVGSDAAKAHMSAALDALCARPFELACGLAEGMRARRSGKLVFVTSAAPLRGLANYVPYATARGAANAMVTSLALELAPDNVTVNAVAPNYIATETYFPAKLLSDEAALAKMTRRIPLRRLGTADEAAAAVDFLLGDGGNFMTGTVLPVAGGWGTAG